MICSFVLSLCPQSALKLLFIMVTLILLMMLLMIMVLLCLWVMWSLITSVVICLLAVCKLISPLTVIPALNMMMKTSWLLRMFCKTSLRLMSLLILTLQRLPLHVLHVPDQCIPSALLLIHPSSAVMSLLLLLLLQSAPLLCSLVCDVWKVWCHATVIIQSSVDVLREIRSAPIALSSDTSASK